MVQCNFKKKFSLYVVLAFIAFTIIGTLSHELGHIAMAKYLGYQTYLSYGSMYYDVKGFDDDEDVKKHKDLFKKNSYEIEKELPFDDEELLIYYLNRIKEKYPVSEKDGLFVTIGGPSQTILTCLLGLLILFFRKSRYRKSFKFLDWLAVFLGLFILREVYNTVTGMFKTAFFGAEQFAGDEFGISRFLGLNQWVIPIITMLIGLAISVYLIFKVIPIQYRFTFIVSGLVGGVLGFSIWFGFLGALFFPSFISF